MNKRETGRAGPLLVGVDAGTTNTKAIIVDLAGRVVAEASEPTRIEYPRPEWAEYAAETLWEVTARAIRRAVAQLDDPRRIEGVAVASMAETAVPLDAKGAATGPAIAWFDKRTRAELALIEERVGPDRLFAISGLAPEPIFGLCKLLWHKRHRPESFARTVKWLNAADYLAWRLSGEMATDYSLASRTFALDLGARQWSREVLEAVGVDPALMAPLVRSGQKVGTVQADAASATGLPRHCVVAAGGHDHMVGSVAADAMRPGVMLLSTGTTEAILMGRDSPGRDPALGRAGYAQGLMWVDEPVYYVMGGVFTAGGAIEWFRRTLGAGAGAGAEGADYATLMAEAEAVPPGSLGALFLPQLRLGTPPHIDGHARGAFLGLSTDITRGCLFRAVLEGIAADSRLCVEGMLRLLPAEPPREVRVIGGLTRNALYMAIRSAVAGRPLGIVDLPDGVAAGAALLAGLGAGLHPTLAAGLAAMRPPEREITPDAALAGLYDRLVREAYAPAYPTVQSLHEAAQKVIAAGRG
ncbi:MAG: FGGY family carbohydrate kinase [Geminicoccaceae bacterium]